MTCLLSQFQVIHFPSVGHGLRDAIPEEIMDLLNSDFDFTLPVRRIPIVNFLFFLEIVILIDVIRDFVFCLKPFYDLSISAHLLSC